MHSLLLDKELLQWIRCYIVYYMCADIIIMRGGGGTDYNAGVKVALGNIHVSTVH